MMFVGFLMVNVMSVARRLAGSPLVSLERTTGSSSDNRSVIVDVRMDPNQKTKFCSAPHENVHTKEDLNLRSHRGGWMNNLKEFVHSLIGSSTWSILVRRSLTHLLLIGLILLVAIHRRIVAWCVGLSTEHWETSGITGFSRCVLPVQSSKPYWIDTMKLVAKIDDHVFYVQ